VDKKQLPLRALKFHGRNHILKMSGRGTGLSGELMVGLGVTVNSKEKKGGSGNQKLAHSGKRDNGIWCNIKLDRWPHQTTKRDPDL